MSGKLTSNDILRFALLIEEDGLEDIGDVEAINIAHMLAHLAGRRALTEKKIFREHEGVN